MVDEHRTDRAVVYLTEREAAVLRRRAGHRPLSAYLRHLAIGSRPGAVESADDWWDSLPALRREQIHQFLAGGRGDHRPFVAGEDPLPLG